MSDTKTVIKADRMFDSFEGIFRNNPVITVQDDSVLSVQFGHVDVPRCCRLIELDGHTILPGLIDAHDHLSLSPQLANHPMLMSDPDGLLVLRAIENMKTDLLSGITTSRCLGDKNFIDIHLRQAVENKEIIGPRIITCTRGIRATHAHGAVGTPFNGAAEIRAAIRMNIQHGADFIKIFMTDTVRKKQYMPYYYTAEEVQVAVTEAHQVGKQIAVHAIGGDGLDICIKEGVDVIEHAYFASASQIEEMIKRDRWVVLTPSIFFNDDRWSTVPPHVAEEFARNREEVYERYQAIVKSGLRYAIGTDATHGRLQDDVITLVGMGASLPTALRGVTLHAAILCELEHSIGSIQHSKKADLIAVRGNVEQDIHCLSLVSFVMKDGIVYKHDQIQS